MELEWTDPSSVERDDVDGLDNSKTTKEVHDNENNSPTNEENECAAVPSQFSRHLYSESISGRVHMCVDWFARERNVCTRRLN